MNLYLHRFAVATSCCTFFLIIAGGLVTSTGSGLSVPDWPNTYGHFMFAYPLDQMVGGIFYEHTHRMIASFVGFLTLILAVWLWRKDDRRWVRNLGVIALCAVIFQGILGGLTVQFLLPTPISVSHATLAQSFFALVSSLALFTSRWWRSEQPSLDDQGRKMSTPMLSMLAAGCVLLQLVLGALMRHTHSGLAVPDFPAAYGQLFPSVTPEAVATYNQQLLNSEIRIAADDPVTATQIVIHMLHRIWAVVTSTMVIWTSIRLLRFSSASKRMGRFGMGLIALLALQVSLGIFTVIARKPVDITTAHVATGSVLLVVSTLVTLHLTRLIGFAPRRPSIRIIPHEVAA